MPEIIVKHGDNVVQRCFFFREPLRIGRSPENEIVIDHPAVAPTHATIAETDGTYRVVDHGGEAGTLVNDLRVGEAVLRDRDVLTIGEHRLYFYDQASAEVRMPRTGPMPEEVATQAETVELPSAALEVNKGRQKGLRFMLSGEPTTVGRGPGNDIRLSDWFVSKEHALIEVREGKYWIRDLGSWRHTFVNGEAIQESPLFPGDVIMFGPTVEIVFKLAATGEGETAESFVGDVGSAATESAVDETEEAPRTPALGEVKPLDALWYAGQPASAEAAADQEPQVSAEVFADALYEELAESTLKLAADALGGSGRASNGTATVEQATENRIDSRPCRANDAVCESTDDEKQREIAMWMRALENKSPVIRRQAARRLKQLTGRDYEA